MLSNLSWSATGLRLRFNLLYTADMPASQTTFIDTFAADTFIIATADSHKAVSNQLQPALDNIMDQCLEYKIEMS